MAKRTLVLILMAIFTLTTTHAIAGEIKFTGIQPLLLSQDNNHKGGATLNWKFGKSGKKRKEVPNAAASLTTKQKTTIGVTIVIAAAVAIAVANKSNNNTSPTPETGGGGIIPDDGGGI